MQQPGKKIRKWMIQGILERKHHCVIGLKSKIGSHYRTVSPEGTVIGEGVTIGNECKTYGRVTFGQKNGLVPQIGNNVVIYQGAVIIGNIVVGDNAEIMENAVVLDDVPAFSIVSGIPAKVVSQ